MLIVQGFDGVILGLLDVCRRIQIPKIQVKKIDHEWGLCVQLPALVAKVQVW